MRPCIRAHYAGNCARVMNSTMRDWLMRCAARLVPAPAAPHCSETSVPPKQLQRACNILESAPEQGNDKDQQHEQQDAGSCRSHAQARCTRSQNSGDARVEWDGRGWRGCCARGGGGRQLRFELRGVVLRRIEALHIRQSDAGQHVVGDVLSPAVALTPNGNCSKHRARAVSHERGRVQLHAQPF